MIFRGMIYTRQDLHNFSFISYLRFKFFFLFVDGYVDLFSGHDQCYFHLLFSNLSILDD